MKQAIYRLTTQMRTALLAAVTIAVGSTVVMNLIADGKSTLNRKIEVVVDNTPINREGGSFNSFSPVIKGVSPSVVNIFTETKSKKIEGSGNQYGNDPFFRQFFGGRSRPDYYTQPQKGLGSGVIISQDGYILTNNHVIENADIVNIALNPDGKEYKAKVVGTDPNTDIAILKINETDLPYIKLANSDLVEVGDLVLAIGNPFGVGQTVTMGMVSAMGRSGAGLDYEDFIQTDAAINPGNSGGALVDAQGRLIGINTLIISRTGGNHGIGYAIPVNLARHVMEELINDGEVSRGYLGVGIQKLTPELAKAFDVEGTHGALVSSVESNGAADKAGIESGDIIVKFNGATINDSQQLRMKVAQTSPESEIKVTLLRKGDEKEITVVLDERGGLASSQGSRQAEDEGVLNGVTVDDLDRTVRQQLRIPRGLEGAVVVSVDRESPSFEAGLKPGDVIIEINHKTITNASEAVDISGELEINKVVVKIWRGGFTTYLVVDESQLG